MTSRRRRCARLRACARSRRCQASAGASASRRSRAGSEDGALLVRGLMMGVCGTDREIAEGGYGEPPPGESELIIGHEGLGEVLEAPAGSGFVAGDLVVGIVRRPDPVPCPACAAGEWDMCRNDRFVERGIVRRHGYGSERWRVEPDYVLRIPSSSVSSACCSSRPPCWQRRGTRSTGFRSGRSSSAVGRWSPARGRSGCWPACSACSGDLRCTSSTWPPRASSATWSKRSARTITPEMPRISPRTSRS